MFWGEPNGASQRRTGNLQPVPTKLAAEPRTIQPRQLRRLQALWRRWAGRLALPPEQDRRLRHYYIWAITQHRCPNTRMLSEQQAAQVIAWLGRRVRQAEAPLDHIAGVAGRRGYPEHRRVPPTAAAWRTLWRCAAALGMNRAELDRFIQRHYRSAGLQGVASLRTMADMNRVLWGLKAVLRHRTKPGDCARQPRRAA